MEEIIGLLDGRFLALVMALCLIGVRLLRQIQWIDQRPQLLPLLSIAVGCAVAILLPLSGRVELPGALLPGWWILDALLHGIAAGLLASGAYSAGVKALVPKTEEQRKD